MRLDRFRALTGALVAAALAAGLLAACGGDDDEAQSLTFEVNGTNVTGPSSAETGEAELTLDNSGKKDGDLQFFRVQGDRSQQEFIRGVSPVFNGGPFPDWITGGGGVGTTAGGESQVVTQVLEPGTYFALNTTALRAPPEPGTLYSFDVTGEAADEELEADATVETIDYGFKTNGLEVGENEVLFTNTGAQPHHILAAKLNEGVTAADAEKRFKAPPSQSGPPPFDEESGEDTAVVEGGGSQLVTLDFEEPGKYVFFCFISDRQGGPPHVEKGMVDSVDIK